MPESEGRRLRAMQLLQEDVHGSLSGNLGKPPPVGEPSLLPSNRKSDSLLMTNLILLVSCLHRLANQYEKWDDQRERGVFPGRI